MKSRFHVGYTDLPMPRSPIKVSPKRRIFCACGALILLLSPPCPVVYCCLRRPPMHPASSPPL
eukprot:3948133-Prymnesium_polylepis.2